MKTLYKSIFWATVVLFIMALVFSLFLNTEPEPEQLTISQLVQKINAGEITKVVINGNNLEIGLKDGKQAIAKKESEVGLSETLKNYGVTPAALNQISLEVKDESGFRFWMGVLLPTLLPLIVMGLIFWYIFRQARTGAAQAFTFGRSNIKLFSSFREQIAFKDVAGLKEAKEELEEVVDFLKNPKKFLEIGARIPRGILLMGAPGTGKTLLARAVAGESGVPFFHISASEFVEMFVGVGAARTRDAFATAKKASPSILFIDEIDAVGRERGAGLGGGHDEREQTLNQILVEMDGFERDTRVIVLAATNRPDILDRALLRPGRFDRRVILDLPDINDREEILKIHTQDKMVSKNINLRQVAIRTPGFSGADLANLTNEAAILAARKNRKEVSQEDLLNSIEKIILGPQKKGKVITDTEKKITAYHEAGHALATTALKGADPIQKVSVIGRGRAGGYTLKLPLEEQRLKTRSQFLTDIAVALGGYISEQIIFGEMSTGASNDLKEATNLARALVMQYGMSEKLGPQTFGETHDLMFLGREITSERNYSEEMAAKIDTEVKHFIDRAYNAAKKVLISNRRALDAIAKTLIEKEELEKEEFDKLIGKFKLKKIAV